MSNRICEAMRRAGRDHVTPEDVITALKKFRINKIRRDVLELVTGMLEIEVKDIEVCAYIAWKAQGQLIERKEEQRDE